jgi:hypothetical protein
MSRLRANIVVNKDANGPFLASQGLEIADGKTITTVSGNTVLNKNSLTTTNVITSNLTTSGTTVLRGSINLTTVSGTTIINDISLTTTDITSNTLTTNQVNLGSNERIRIGDAQDLQIYHDGTDSKIQESSKLVIDSFPVELHHSSSKKFNTTISGVAVTGGITSTTGWKGTTTSANVLGGIAMPFVCGRNGRIALPIVNTTMLFGGSEYGDDNTQGVLMPHNGKLVAATLNAENIEGNSEIEVLVNGTKNSSYKFNITSSIRGDFNQIQTWYNSPLSFSAGHRINFVFATTTITYMEVLSITFFVVFD